ncbi:16S rRNA (uracil(1498)-N(3))-methyltransferase [Lewinella sp. JB7]|uniref:RsmE family RNA methyltransferase n=1 Tax=Lewinella sp. JB7 TaxID=2962887 RepID=UPI0020C9F26D|nr:RsmE family RNA methyltransferase [Lewinella sp. JB7]MCP9235439.1 16S rRNA (uracil(1498)-N(3))-methyltransferase [Lewinella sp. JB7]
MQLFFDPDVTPGRHALRETEAIHAARVLRRREGDTIDLVDGRGGWYSGLILDISKRHCTLDVQLVRREDQRSSHALTLLVAPPKNIDRFEWILEKATELGVDRIQPIFTEHSQRTRLRTDRLQRVIESAMKQSLKAWLPQLPEPVSFVEAMQTKSPSRKYLAYLGEQGSRLLHQMILPGTNVEVAIGPEGGFSPAEADMARDHGWTFASLGPHRLRTETAAIAAVHAVEMVNWQALSNPGGPQER